MLAITKSTAIVDRFFVLKNIVVNSLLDRITNCRTEAVRGFETVCWRIF